MLNDVLPNPGYSQMAIPFVDAPYVYLKMEGVPECYIGCGQAAITTINTTPLSQFLLQADI